MGRWRAPGAASSVLITPEGLRRLQEELTDLWTRRRPEVVAALSAAAAEGDRSENAEYIYRKKQLAEIDRRVRYLGKRIPSLRASHELPADQAVIYFGAYFRVEDADGSEHAYRIVGPDESDARRGWISIDSPFARAALGRRIDDEFEVATPTGVRMCCVVAVAYE
ncbi:MAG TPA: transcription elongation factor GreB [Dokdonella sp.]|uniref:transcription elongation factor GreB n=1 Tax=Dokdonella sp. TaxID=2291710 RepID=UPI0025BDA395|nr:transcription elongation factor GreB [Dokdonella sp.]MBX3692955.1 transcription elongation factor GreB [Dokdonella sp.]MCW5568580.1 transcription elongation factor GreB [Dokdonella sp.]HNR91320.1 transcription elongation factor GreB [Dokdonella sp.]